MSYEGYEYYLCKAGHLQEIDYMQDPPKICARVDCGEPIVWWNSVDITNGSFAGKRRIDGYIKLKISQQRKCEHCKSILETIYQIPRTKGHNIIKKCKKS